MIRIRTTAPFHNDGVLKVLCYLFFLFALIFSTGCATTTIYDKHIADAEASAERKDWETSYRHVEETLRTGYTNYTTKAVELTKKYPLIVSKGVEKSFLSDLQQLDTGCNQTSFEKLIDRLITLIKVGLTDIKTQSEILARSKTVLNKCASSETSNVSLTSIYAWETDLGDDFFTVETKSSAFKRQVDEAKTKPDVIDDSIPKFINSYPDMKAPLESKLPEIQWMGHSKATHIIKSLFPSYYDEIYKKSSIIINVKTNPKKPLLELDISEELSKHIMISAYQDNPNANYTIIVNELAYEEQNIPEQTVQKYVSYWNITFFAVLCYPKNATPIYDVTTGGSIIRYAYKIDLMANAQVIDSVTMRDSVKDTYAKASNLRYQNVFGGVGVPDCYPNTAVEQEFRSSTSSVSIESLRKEVFDSLAGKIKEFPQIKKAVSFGKK